MPVTRKTRSAGTSTDGYNAVVRCIMRCSQRRLQKAIHPAMACRSASCAVRPEPAAWQSSDAAPLRNQHCSHWHCNCAAEAFHVRTLCAQLANRHAGTCRSKAAKRTRAQRRQRAVKQQHAQRSRPRAKRVSALPSQPRGLLVPRLAILKRLQQIEEGQAFIALAGGQVQSGPPHADSPEGSAEPAHKRSGSEAEQRKRRSGEQAVTAAVGGVLRWRRQLDAVIERYAPHVADKALRQVRPPCGLLVLRSHMALHVSRSAHTYAC